MDEFVRTPKSDINSAGTTAEEVLRNMLRRKLATKGKKMADVVRVTPDTVDDLVARTGGKKVTEIDVYDSSITYVALNLRTPNGIKRASQDDYIIEHADGSFDVIKKHEV